jgi:D-lyxose ketol-isomerase
VTLENSDFYDADGQFLVEKARDAYFAMMESFSYPITNKLRSEMWATDFGLGDFVGAGMAGIFWVNDLEHKYFGHEILLLPGQMIVEHSHVPAGDVTAKMESWQVRHGMIYTFAEGDETIPCPVQTPASQAEFITAKQVKEVPIGEIDTLNRPEAMHFMLAGPEGAIVTEYATFHDNDGLRFTNPNVKF